MAATIPITVTPEEQAALLARAKGDGVSVDTMVRKAVLQIICSGDGALSPQQLRGADLERSV